MASSPEGVWVGTDKGILRVVGAQATTIRPRFLKMRTSMTFYSDLTEGVRGLSVDRDGRVWAIPRWPFPAICVLNSRGHDGEQAAYRLSGLWMDALSGAPEMAGVWGVGWDGKADRAVMHLTPDILPGREQPPRPEDATVDIRGLLDSGLSPRLSRIQIKASPDEVWVCGTDDTGHRIFTCRDNAMVERTGYEHLLGSNRVTDIAYDAGGSVYFATDGGGIIVFDGQEWRAHAMNEQLPVLEGTNRKPVNYVLPLPDGRLAVCTGGYLLIWGGEQNGEEP